jgi:hypothetical protein
MIASRNHVGRNGFVLCRSSSVAVVFVVKMRQGSRIVLNIMYIILNLGLGSLSVPSP